MSNTQRKARKRAGEKFERKEKTPTGVYISKNDQRKAMRKFERDLAEKIRQAVEEEEAAK